MSKNENKGKSNQKSGNNASMPDRIKEIKERVQNYYLGRTEGKGELNKVDVLKHLQTEEFVREFTQWYGLSEASSVKKIVKAVATKFIQRDKENESKCQGFVDTISNFTNGFDFLASEIESFKAMRGAKATAKLPSVDDYSRLLELKAKINTIMQSEQKTEAEAIRDLLSTQKSNVQLKTEEAMILRRRIDVIDGKVKTAPKKEGKTSMSKAKTAINKVGNRTNLPKPAENTQPKATTTAKTNPPRSLKSVQERLKRASEKADAQKKRKSGTNTLASIAGSSKAKRTESRTR